LQALYTQQPSQRQSAIEEDSHLSRKYF
jgi:hypothetical protein